MSGTDMIVHLSTDLDIIAGVSLSALIRCESGCRAQVSQGLAVENVVGESEAVENESWRINRSKKLMTSSPLGLSCNLAISMCPIVDTDDIGTVGLGQIYEGFHKTFKQSCCF